MKEFANDTFKLDENGVEFSKRVEKNSSFFSVFKRFVLQTCKNKGLFRKGLI